MTIENSEGFRGFEVYCDFCPEDTYMDFGRDEWSDMIAELKADGWKIFKDDDGNWTHKCPDCATKGRN